MKPSKFLTGLGLTCLLQAACTWVIIGINPLVSAHISFITISMIAMVIFCCMMYLGARIIARSKLTRLFIQLIMIAVFLKMLVCLALIIGYKNGYHPADDTFVWPFLMIYVTTTVYEVIFLESVGREKQTPSP